MIIAEIGLNHLGSIKRAKKFIDKLVLTNVDAVTFQIREPEYKTPYTLPEWFYHSAKTYLKIHQKQFGIAIADVSKIDFFESLNVDFYKVIRNDILNTELINKLILTNKKIIVSTGTCSEEDIQIFIKKYKNNNIVLNHTQLSHNINDCNLSAISTLKNKFKINVSYGNHCTNHNVLYMALCYNPSDILFYVKGSPFYNYPDDKHAINIKNVKKISANLSELNQAIGSGIKNRMEIKIK